ncbi:MAG: cyclic nucleotide-binding domain-containing protein, partial [Ilumatobacteraceae bacterium]
VEGAGNHRFSPVRTTLRNHALVRAVAALFNSTVSEWALWIGALVYAHDHGGAAAAGAVSIALVIPAACVAPLAGTRADGPRPNRLLGIVYGVQTLCLAAAAIAAFQDAPVVVVVVPIAATTTLVTFIRPTYSVAIPGLVTAPAQLTAANVLIGYFENAAILVGPLMAAALLSIGSPALVLAGCAALLVGSTLCSIPLAKLDPPASFMTNRVTAAVSMTRMSLSAVRRLAERPGAIALLIVIAGQYVLVGGLDLLYVVLAADRLHLAASGPGMLSAAFGVGAIMGGAVASFFVARRRLAPVIIGSSLAVVAALVALGADLVLVATLLLLPVMGIGRTIIDVTGRMLLQRAAPQDALASVFATLEALTLAGTAVGLVLVQVLIGAAGVRTALFGLGIVLGLLLLATAFSLRRVDEIADAPVVAIRLLKSAALFASLPPIEIEGVARAGDIEHFAPGSKIINSGDIGDHYYVIAGGTVEVFVDGQLVRTLGRAEGFGEIALLADSPRTATVVAATDVDVFAIGRVAFLTAVTGHDASRQAAWGVARSYGIDLSTD